MAKLQDANSTEVLEQRMTLGSQVVQLLRRLPQPIIAAVNGAASRRRCQPGIKLRLSAWLGQGSLLRELCENWSGPRLGRLLLFVRLVGTAKAMELMMTGDRIRAEEALRLGLLNQGLSA